MLAGAYAGDFRVERDHVSPRLERAERDQSDGDKAWGEREPSASALPERKWSRDFFGGDFNLHFVGLFAFYFLVIVRTACGTGLPRRQPRHSEIAAYQLPIVRWIMIHKRQIVE
jgi:hypothetical protein